MKVLIVHAHPEPKSFTTAMKNAAVETFSSAGHMVTVSDLYAMRFNPVAGPDDFVDREDPNYLVYALEQRHAYETGTLADDIAVEVEKLATADLLILSCPIYWFSVPAVLKGWIDRVLLSGPFYGGKRFYDRGGLKGKRALVTMTLGGREHMFGPGAVHGEIETMLRPLLRGTLYYVGMEILKPYLAYHVPYIDDAARGHVIEDYRAYLSDLDNAPALTFPSLDDFDDRLYPKTL